MNRKITRLAAMVAGIATLGSFAASLPVTAQTPPGICERSIKPPNADCEDGPSIHPPESKTASKKERTGQKEEEDKESYCDRVNVSDCDDEGTAPWQNRPY